MMSWRDFLRVHPAAELFDLMAPAELTELGEDINANDLLQPMVLWRDGPDAEYLLLDGRNRLDAMELAGLPVAQNIESLLDMSVTVVEPPTGPYNYVFSANMRRRHLTGKQKRGLIAKLMKFKPDMPDRQIAKLVGVSPTTAGDVRCDLEEAGDVSKLDTRTDAQGRQQPAHKSRSSTPRPKPKSQVEPSQDIEQSERFPTAAPASSQQPEEPAPTSASPEPKPVESTAERETANTPSCKPPPLAPTPVPPADPFEAIEAEIDTLLPRWLVRAKNALSTPEVMKREPLRRLMRRLKAVHDRGAGWQATYHHARQEDPWRQAYEVRGRAARKAGRLLRKSLKAGLRTDGHPDPKKQIGTPTNLLSLEDFGISGKESRNWQALARLTDAEFEARLARGLCPCDQDQKPAGLSHNDDTGRAEPPSAAAERDPEPDIAESSSLVAEQMPRPPVEEPVVEAGAEQQQAEDAAIEAEETVEPTANTGPSSGSGVRPAT